MTIRNRIFVYIFLSSVLIIVGIFMVVFYWFSNFYLRETINYAERMVRLVALESRDLILTNDLIALRNLYKATIVSNSHITYIFVEKNSEVLAHTFIKGVPRGLLNLEEFPDQSDLNVIPIENNEGDLIYHFRVMVGKPSFALMHLGISTQALKAELIPLHRLMILVGCFLTIVVPICVAYFLSRIISKPINILHHGSERIGRGELGYRLDINTGDEIQQLADGFNRMSERLETSYATLEQKVAERTENLKKEIAERERAQKELQHLNENLENMVKNRTRELMKARELLFQKEKLAVLGQLAGGIGHELRKPIGNIKNVCYFINMKIDEIKDTAIVDNINIINQEINAANKIISDMLGSSQLKQPEFQDVDINQLITETLSRAKIPGNIMVVTDFPKDILPLSLDPVQAGQVFLNLIENSIQAMEEGGTIKISTRSIDNTIEANFADSGCGIPEKNLEKIFEPLFTSKTDGIGLGLAITKSLVEANGGVILVESIEGKGCSFTVRFTRKELTSEKSTSVTDLTKREREILQLLAEGITNKEIAIHLNLSANTVHVHRNHIMQKLDIHKQVDLVRYALKEGISHL